MLSALEILKILQKILDAVNAHGKIKNNCS